MSDAITIEVDGELGEPDYLPERPRPRWGMPAAVAIVVILVGALVWTFAGSGDSQARTAPVPTPEPTAPVASTAPPTTQPPTPSSTAVPSLDPVVPDLSDPVEVTEAALAAWGAFAVTGDLSVLAPYFADDGPQLEQLRGEAASLGGPANARGYLVELVDPSPLVSGDVATVETVATWTRAGEPTQEYQWSIELRRSDGEWRVWTVRTLDN